MENKERNEWYRRLPKMDVLLEDPDIRQAIAEYGKAVVSEELKRELEAIRNQIPGMKGKEELDAVLAGLKGRVGTALSQRDEGNLKRVINATGVILHTNLGRAPLPEQALVRAMNRISGYSNLEYDLEEGKRGERYGHFEELLCKVTGAEAAFAVNNNAAAVLLVMSAIGGGKEIIVSRGEQVEIGGKFRIPDIMDQSGCRRMEVGTTNKTRISDYEEKISEETAALLKVHRSNFHMEGFTESVSREELAELGKKYSLPVIEDLGSGVLVDLSKYGLKKEPTVQESLAAGVDVVCFSGDKLFGGPQAGIIVGKKKWIDKCKKHPLTRAMRIDKFTVAVLEETIKMYQDTDYAVSHIPVLSMLTADIQTLKKRAEQMLELLKELREKYEISMVSCEATAGGGSLPGEVLQSVGIRIYREDMHSNTLEEALRRQPVPLILRIEEEGLLLDMRTIRDEELEEAAEILKKVLC